MYLAFQRSRLRKNERSKMRRGLLKLFCPWSVAVVVVVADSALLVASIPRPPVEKHPCHPDKSETKLGI
jgi:hypothetical protein